MKKNKSDRKVSEKLNIKAVLYVLTLMLFVFFILFFSFAFKDGMTHFAKGEAAIVSPDFIADKNSAKKIDDFRLKDINGDLVSFSQFNSVDVIVLNIWSAGCPVCREEIPSITELDRRLKKEKNITLITIAIADSFEDVSTYFPAGSNLRILFDGKDRVGFGIFGTSQYPETFILDKQRRVRARFDGKRDWHSDAFIGYLKTFL
ncbi:MAG: TlpA family protein disulfide reductase [Deltaproteobacteria bacterium]|nr:TlpA family protein disulfide reductase [Deltaproteobacteria bacterium]